VARFKHPWLMLLFAVATSWVQTARANPYLGDDQPPDGPIRRLTFTCEPRWLVIGEAFRNERLAALRCGEPVAAGFSATPVQSDLFANLRPGLVVLIYGAFPTVKPARADTTSRLVDLFMGWSPTPDCHGE
jgi:hypothetical protein